VELTGRVEEGELLGVGESLRLGEELVVDRATVSTFSWVIARPVPVPSRVASSRRPIVRSGCRRGHTGCGY